MCSYHSKYLQDEQIHSKSQYHQYLRNDLTRRERLGSFYAASKLAGFTVFSWRYPCKGGWFHKKARIFILDSTSMMLGRLPFTQNLLNLHKMTTFVDVAELEQCRPWTCSKLANTSNHSWTVLGAHCPHQAESLLSAFSKKCCILLNEKDLEWWGPILFSILASQEPRMMMGWWFNDASKRFNDDPVMI